MDKANATIENLLDQQKELKETHKNDIWGKLSTAVEKAAPAVAPALGGFLSQYLPKGANSLGSIDEVTQQKIDFVDNLVDDYGFESLRAFFEALEKHQNPALALQEITTQITIQ